VGVLLSSIFVFTDDPVTLFSMFIIQLALLFFLFYYIGKVRDVDITEIANIIRSIRLNSSMKAEDIQLNPTLGLVEVELKETLVKIQADINYLTKLERMRTEFLANVSHELKTPIFAITGYLETLEAGAVNDPKVNAHFLNKAIQHTENLSSLLNDLIDLSMIETGEMRMSFRYFNLDEFINPIIAEFSEFLEKKRIKLLYLPEKPGLLVYGDKKRLKQVMSNLISNAIKYTEQGNIKIYAIVMARDVKIVVADSGIGIDPDDQMRIFERFYRVDKARSKEIGGTGLGLAIVKHIIDAHGSKIEVKSELNKGSEFSFALKM